MPMPTGSPPAEAALPALDPKTYCFVHRPFGSHDLPRLEPLMRFEEAEGTTLIVEAEAAAAAHLEGSFPCRRITIGAVTSLSSVGLMAAVSTRMAEAGIPVNPVAGFYHDHLFVPVGRAEEALALLLSPE